MDTRKIYKKKNFSQKNDVQLFLGVHIYQREHTQTFFVIQTKKRVSSVRGASLKSTL